MNLRILFLCFMVLGAGYAFAQTPIPGNALHFDGENDYVTIPDANALDLSSSYTMECWIRPERFNFLAGLISKYNAVPSNGYLLRLGSVPPYTGLSFDGMETATGILQTDTWCHIAAVKEENSRKLYVNGREYPLSGTPVNVGANTDVLTLGVDYLPSPRYFKGTMDEVRIWNVARTQSEIQAAISSAIDPASTGLVAYYQFETGTAGGNNTDRTEVADATPLQNHGLATNFTLSGITSNWVASYAMVAPVAYAATGISDNGFTANWTAPSGTAVDHYLLDISSYDDFSTFLAGYNGLNTGDATTLDISGLPAGTTWYYRIRAVSDAAGKSTPSNVMMVATSGEFVPVYSILYVDKNVAGGDHSGNSWENAIPELADALKLARENQGKGFWSTAHPLQIMVAGGTYKPLYHAADGQFATNGSRFNAFVLIRDVRIYGGFDPANGITGLTHSRIPASAAGASVLSGDLNNSGTLNNGDAYHVVISAGNAGTALLDGFKIRGGNANATVLGSIEVNGLKIFNNEGGGFSFNASSPALINLVITGNYAELGGGMLIQNSSHTVTNTAINGNSASNGGGIYASGIPAFTLTNVAISGNRAINYGGGITADGSALSLTNVTISGNRAVDAGGGAIFSLESTVRIDNSIIYGNSTGIYLDRSPAPEYRYSLVQEATLNDGNGNINGGTNPLFADRIPFVSAPSAAGDYTLNAGSPVLNLGNNALFAGLSSSSADLAGNPRVYDFDDGKTIDPGAYEYQGQPGTPPVLGGILYVDSNITGGDQSGESWENAYKELADALKWARENQYKDMWDAGNPLQIWVAGGTYKPLYLATDGQFTNTGTGNAARNRAFVLIKDVKIYGGFDPGSNVRTLADRRISPSAVGASVLSGDLNGSGTLNGGDAYHVVASTGIVGVATIDGFRITGGYANGNGSTITVNSFSIYNYDGGGIDLSSSSPALTNLVISGNYSRYGGGIMAENSSPAVTNSVISGNWATEGGGGMYSFFDSSPVLINVTISGNRTRAGEGGGIYSNQSTSALRIYNSIVSGNTSGVELYVSPSTESRYSLIQDLTTDDANGNVDGSADPLFTDAPAPGGAPFTNGDYTLRNGSPAIDNGSNMLFNGANDMAGNPRISGGTIDMGAYEYFSPLPVTLLSFKAIKQENTVLLNWQTAGEADFSHFEIQRSDDSRAWQSIGAIRANGNGSYIFTDKFPLSTFNYYRLKMTDLDGTYTYSPIEAASFDGNEGRLTIRIYPNPARDGKVTIEATGHIASPVNVQITDLMGREVYTSETGSTKIDVSRFTPGLYLVNIRQGNESTIRKLIVE